MLRHFENISVVIGSGKKEFACEQCFKINIFVDEVLSLDDVYENYNRCAIKNQELEKEIKKIYQEIEEEIKKRDTREEKLLEENERLDQYVKKLERYSGLPEKDGKDISKVSPTTKWRFLKELKTRAQKALWFMKQFGLTIQSLEAKQNDGDFGKLYFEKISLLGSVDANSYCKQAKDWINLFCSLGNKRTGYGKKNVTCYMHAVVYHVPGAIEKYGNVKQFTGQGVEKNNDDARRVVKRKSNNLDSPTDVLLTESRLRSLRKRERTPRTYNKQNVTYWDNGIKQSRAKHKRLSFQMSE
ncbi:hypothetical protein OS493_019495 [Desmophyllum pertusum]|uniref:Uncharacterized protein n=1 Tax=Desmophyllum pertusum TaxID=174260 RepID=A0A9W9ZQ86_9CNID|nr:hypothetical protein OS493_019495 [Desmophyllum pertusum]